MPSRVKSGRTQSTNNNLVNESKRGLKHRFQTYWQSDLEDLRLTARAAYRILHSDIYRYGTNPPKALLQSPACDSIVATADLPKLLIFPQIQD